MVAAPITTKTVIGASRTTSTWATKAASTVVPPKQVVDDELYGNGVEVEIGEHRFRCSAVLGRGSYGEVWQASVVSGQPGPVEVALKEVNCRTQSELQQAIFEVQVLLALEGASSPFPDRPLRVPRCICYQVDPSSSGWKVRTAMTVVPGQSLDYFVRRPPIEGRTCLKALERGVALAAKCLVDVGPSLQLLQPIAWHRDVNSHNILVDDAPDDADAAYIKAHASFWLIDFGLAVDSQSWVSENGKWRTEYIGGDSRYWPPSSWMMHLLGPEGFEGLPDLCEQYQRRLDIHGLGITALELLCSVALVSLGAEEELGPWEAVLTSWQQYRDEVWHWWAAVYSVFSSGGDLAPVQAQLVQEGLVEQLLELLLQIRSALKNCAAQVPGTDAGLLLDMMANMLDEGHDFDLMEIQRILGPICSQSEAVEARTQAAVPQCSDDVSLQTPERSLSAGQCLSESRRSEQKTAVEAQPATLPPAQCQPAGSLSEFNLSWNGVPLPALDSPSKVPKLESRQVEGEEKVETEELPLSASAASADAAVQPSGSSASTSGGGAAIPGSDLLGCTSRRISDQAELPAGAAGPVHAPGEGSEGFPGGALREPGEALSEVALLEEEPEEPEEPEQESFHEFLESIGQEAMEELRRSQEAVMARLQNLQAVSEQRGKLLQQVGLLEDNLLQMRQLSLDKAKLQVEKLVQELHEAPAAA